MSMQGGAARQGEFPLALAVRRSKRALLHVAILSGLVNVLMLTSSVFMMQVYDRVLGSRSVATLVALAAIALIAYMMQWVFDMLRQRLVGLVGERMETESAPIIQRAAIEIQLRGARSQLETLQIFRDMDSVRSFMSGQGPLAFFDLPWIPIYLVVTFALHPILGWATVVGATVLVALTIATELTSRAPTSKALVHASMRNQMADAAQRGAEVLRALGMERSIWARWNSVQDTYISEQRRAADIIGLLSSLSRSLRFVLQSVVLGLGAYLVVRGELSGGAIIAASILAGRALAPIDLAIGSWRPFVQARQSYARLKHVLPEFMNRPERMALPAPRLSFQLRAVDVHVPGIGKPVVRNVTLALKAGDGLGVIGHSASGKSSLSRVMVGVWPPARGRVLLDGAGIDNYDPEALGPSIGYMPQDVQFFDGTIAENIARFQPNAPPDKVIAAAKAASFHAYVLGFPDGYDTRIGPAGAHLSAGQRQRLGLARALYGEPFLVVLDEPNANLDADGENAVSAAIKGVRDRGGIAIVIAHRPSALTQVNLLMVLSQGEVAGFGPRDEVLAKTVKNTTRLVPPAAPPPVVVSQRPPQSGTGG